jgi:hypothetical protein
MGRWGAASALESTMQRLTGLLVLTLCTGCPFPTIPSRVTTVVSPTRHLGNGLTNSPAQEACAARLPMA